MVNGWDTPSHDYDLIHQRIEVSNFDWDSTSFDGRVTTTLVAKRDGFDAVRLDMRHLRKPAGSCSSISSRLSPTICGSRCGGG